MKKVMMLITMLCLYSIAWGQSIEEIREKAMAGDPKAQVKLGDSYMFGRNGLTKNEEEGLKWYKKAAAQNYDTGSFALGSHYFAVFLVNSNSDKDKQEAIYWLKKSLDDSNKSGEDDGSTAKCLLKELGVTYHPGKKTSTTTSTASSQNNSNETPHSFVYERNQGGVHVVSTNDNKIIIENDDDKFTLGNLGILSINDNPNRVLSINLSESKSMGRINQLLWKGCANLAITLSNGEVFRCSSNVCDIKKGYGKFPTSLAATIAFFNLRSTNSPSGTANGAYAEKQFSTYNITKIVLNEHSFVVHSSSMDTDKDYMMRSACTIKAMLDELKKH